MKQNCMCIQLYFHTYKHIFMYLNKHVNYLQFLRMKFSSLSTIGTPEGSLFFSPLFLCSPNFPFCVSTTTTHLPTFSLLLICITHFPFNNCLTGNLLGSSCVLSCGRREREWYSRNLPSECQCFSQETRPLILNTRQRCDSNYKKDWDLLLEPSPTLSCWGPDYYDSGWGVGSRAPASVRRKWLEIESGDHTWVNWANPEQIIQLNWIKLN